MQYKLLNNEKNDFRRKIWDKRPGSGIMNKNIRGKRMQNQKKASIKLSLHQEIDREIQELEREIARHPELEEIQVTEEMDRTLLEKIRAYEKEKEERRLAEEKMGETLRRLRDDVAEDEKIGGSKRPDVEAGAGGVRNFRSAEDHVEVPEEIVPDLSRLVVGENGRGPMDMEDGAERKVLYRRKKRKYWVISLAAVLVIVMGVGVNSVGSKSYWKNLWDSLIGNEPIKYVDVEDMEIQEIEDGNELAAYREIKEKLNIKPVRLIYKPDEMELKDYEIFEEMLMARLVYKYKDEVIRYILYINSADSSWGEKEEDIKIDEYKFVVDEVEITVEEFQVRNISGNRQVANFDYKGVHYQLAGVMQREEIKKILENLYFL